MLPRPPRSRLIPILFLLLPSFGCTPPQISAEEHFAIGNRRLDDGDWEGAIESYSAALEQDSRLAKAYNNRGLALLAMKEYHAAIADFDISITMTPAFSEAYYNRGIAHYRNAEPGRAVVDLTEALRLNPGYVNAFAARGLVFKAAGDPRSALKDFHRTLELAPPDWPDRKVIEKEIGDLEETRK